MSSVVSSQPISPHDLLDRAHPALIEPPHNSRQSAAPPSITGGAKGQRMGTLVAAGNFDGKADGSTSNGDIYGDVVIGVPGVNDHPASTIH